MARRCDQVTQKVVFTVCPPMLHPQNGHNLDIQTPLELHDPPNRSQWKVVCVHIPLVRFDNISEAISPCKIEFRMILPLACTLPPFRELTHGQIYINNLWNNKPSLHSRTRKTTGSVWTEGGGSLLHQNQKDYCIHVLSPIPLPPSLFHQPMHYSWLIKYVTAHPHYVYAHEKL
jgi:hypothetical protein